MTKRKTHHVVPNSEGGWKVKKGGGKKAVSISRRRATLRGLQGK